MRKFAIAAASLAAVAGIAPAAHADGGYISPTNERVRASLGVMHLSNSTTFQINSTTGVPGTYLNGEDQFGLDASDDEPKFQVMFRAGERNRVRLDYFTLDRSGSTTVTQPIVFRDSVLQPGDPLQSLLDLRILTLTYGYSFWHSEKLEFAATFGVSSVQISTQAKVTSATRHVDQREDTAGPYPTFGIDGTWVISRRFYLDGRIQYFKLSVNNLDGSLGIFELDALYRWRPNVSFALGYNEVKTHLSSNQTSNSGFFDMTSKGPQFFVRVAF